MAIILFSVLAFVIATPIAYKINDGGIMLMKTLNIFILTFTFLLFSISCKYSFWTFVFGVSYDKILFLHRLFGILLLPVMIVENSMAREQSILSRLVSVTVGFVLVSSRVFVFFNMYDYFTYVHRSAALVLVILLIVQRPIVGPLALLPKMIDWTLRIRSMIKNRKSVRVVIAEKVTRDIIQLSFAKESFSYQAGQFVCLTIPELSFWASHPFYFSSSPFQSSVTMHVKVAGDWTKRLSILCSERPVFLNAYIEGPFGDPIVDLHNPNTRMLVVIGAGINCCPLLSIANAMLDQSIRGRGLTRILFFWSLRDFESVKGIVTQQDLLTVYHKSYQEISNICHRAFDKSLVYIELYLSSLIFQNMIPLYIEDEFLHLKNFLFSQKIKIDDVFLKVKEEMHQLNLTSDEVIVLTAGPVLLMDKVMKQSNANGFNCEAFWNKI